MKQRHFHQGTFPGSALSLFCILFVGLLALRGAEPRPISLSRQLGRLNHPVSTTNEMAQQYFNQGLTLIFAFNHDAAIRSFERALRFDHNLAMAHWGIGFSLGPNITHPVSPDAEKRAFEATEQALALLSTATVPERDYIQALQKRYSTNADADLKQLDIQFKNAMRELMRTYPDDLDAATLFAESMMNLHPWQFWSSDGKPNEGTAEIVEVLESVLRRDPDHPGANHYYIHAVEASPFPERALPSAQRLETYAPSAGHLVHMPAHIYLRTGDYAAAARRNEVATEVDLDFVQSCGVQGIYPVLYTSHNMHFAAIAHLLQGRYGSSHKYAERLLLHVQPLVTQIPETEAFLPTMEQVLIAFRRWDEILALPKPPENLKLHSGIWHFSRGMAFASQNKPSEAELEKEALQNISSTLPADATFGPFNSASNIFQIAQSQLSARGAQAAGDLSSAERDLRSAIAIEDTLRYMEPPDWYLPSRQALGGILLTAGDAPAAEKVFREDLRRNPRQGRSLYGLAASLKAQGNSTAAASIERQQQAAWLNANSPLEPTDIWWDPNFHSR